MTVLSDYVSGTISLTNGSVDFTGTGTGWLLAGFKEGDTIIDITGATEFMGVIASIDTNAGGKLTKPWEGPTLVDAPYRMRYQPDGSRVSAQARNLIELLGDGTLTSLAGLTGPGVIELLAGGGAQVVPKSDLVSGAGYDVQVSDLAGRAVYDGQAAGFAVLVSDVGDGRAAIYSKVSNASGDWSDPAYVTGQVGPEADVTVGPTTTLPPGSPATVTPTPTPGGMQLDFGIPAGEGFTFVAGGYNPATAYAKGDVIRDNGSSWIALQATMGNAPPALPATSNAYWELLAQKGQDGTGNGDFVGPAGGVADGDLVAFDGPTGKIGKKAGGVSNAQLATMANATVKGRNTAGTGAPEDVTMAQLLALLKTVGAYAKDNIIGTVSQVAGVPTGEIFERGLNANGEYVKFADGSMICVSPEMPDSTASAANGSVYVSPSNLIWTYPASFSAIPTSIGSSVWRAVGNSWLWVHPVNNLSCNYRIVSGIVNAVGGARLVAIGRWL